MTRALGGNKGDRKMNQNNNFRNNYTNAYKSESKIESQFPLDDLNEKTSQPLIGVATDCMLLCVRKEPSTTSEVLKELECLSEFEIDEKESTENFYKVRTESGIEGFCMKRFVQIKK